MVADLNIITLSPAKINCVHVPDNSVVLDWLIAMVFLLIYLPPELIQKMISLLQLNDVVFCKDGINLKV